MVYIFPQVLQDLLVLDLVQQVSEGLQQLLVDLLVLVDDLGLTGPAHVFLGLVAALLDLLVADLTEGAALDDALVQVVAELREGGDLGDDPVLCISGWLLL